MWVFLGSEFMFFGAFITAYLIYLDQSAGGPNGELFDIVYTSISSFVLLMSSLTMVLAHNAHVHGDMRRMRLWIMATAFQGLVFVGGHDPQPHPSHVAVDMGVVRQHHRERTHQ